MKVLIVQTAFIGDVILATPLIEALQETYPDVQVDFLLRRGNETLLANHPCVRKTWIWDKKRDKYRGLLKLTLQLRREHYDWVFNCQRFAASGLLTVLSGARRTVGFRKNPLSFLFTHRMPHIIGDLQNPVHETERNLSLLAPLFAPRKTPPRLYPGEAEREKIEALAGPLKRYVCMAPTSVWFTKQYPLHKWSELIAQIPQDCAVFLLGAPGDRAFCDNLIAAAAHPDVRNTCGQLSFLESAALMQGAAMNYVNDSAPLHLASAVDAPVAAVFCSTVPGFGFTPLSRKSYVVETTQNLPCRPCGLHGYRACPQGHFACAETINWRQFPLPASF